MIKHIASFNVQYLGFKGFTLNVLITTTQTGTNHKLLSLAWVCCYVQCWRHPLAVTIFTVNHLPLRHFNILSTVKCSKLHRYAMIYGLFSICRSDSSICVTRYNIHAEYSIRGHPVHKGYDSVGPTR